LKKEDREHYIQQYETRLRKFGYSPETLGWGKYGRQEVRFAVLAKFALGMPGSTVLDVGCGFADLYDFLIEHQWRGQYCGIEIVPGLLDLARKRHPDLDLRGLDITSDEDLPEAHDFVIASGVLNFKLKMGDNEQHIQRALDAMFRVARVAVCVDFLSTYVEFQKPDAWHTDPGWVFAQAKQLSRRVILRHDYMPFEFSLFIFRDDFISERNVFRPIENGRSC